MRFDRSEGVPSDKWSALFVTRSGDLWARSEKNVVVRPIEAGGFEPVLNLPPESFKNIRRAVMSEDPSGAVLLNLSSGIAVGGREGWRVLQ